MMDIKWYFCDDEKIYWYLIYNIRKWNGLNSETNSCVWRWNCNIHNNDKKKLGVWLKIYRLYILLYHSFGSGPGIAQNNTAATTTPGTPSLSKDNMWQRDLRTFLLIECSVADYVGAPALQFQQRWSRKSLHEYLDRIVFLKFARVY